MNFTRRNQPDLNWLSDFDRFFTRGRQTAAQPTNRESILETPDAWLLRLDLPGFTKSDIALKVTGPLLQLSGETPPDRAFAGKVDRQWKLGVRIDVTQIKATLENGVLEIALPKTDAPEPVGIEIQ